MIEKPKFNVGDKVAVFHRDYFNGYTTILKITPTGIIRAANGKNYGPNGLLKTSDIWASGKIEPCAQKHEDIMERSNILSQLKKIDFQELSLPQLRRLKVLWDEFEKEVP